MCPTQLDFLIETKSNANENTDENGKHVEN